MTWNKCDCCGRFIPFTDFETGEALRQFITPDSEWTHERYENVCKACLTDNEKERPCA